MRSLVASAILGCVLCSAAAAKSALELIPPKTVLVMGIEWRKIVESPLGDTVIAQIGKAAPMWNPAFESGLRSNLDSMVVAISAIAPGEYTTQPPMLIVVK